MLKVLRKQDYRQAKSWAIVELIHSKYEDVSRGYRPKEIIQDFHKEYGVNITYEKAWKARESCIVYGHRVPKESYTLLVWYEEVLKISNPSIIGDGNQ